MADMNLALNIFDDEAANPGTWPVIKLKDMGDGTHSVVIADETANTSLVSILAKLDSILMKLNAGIKTQVVPSV